MSHRATAVPEHRVLPLVRQHARAQEATVGIEPTSCPWRALYDPLVREVLAIRSLAKEGVASLEADPPAILLDGLDVYLMAYNATRVAEMERERRERDRRK